MAKKAQLDFGSLDIDTGLDFDFGDFDDSKPRASTKREVVLDTAGAIGQGMKETILSPDNVRKALKSSLPSGLSSAWDVADNVSGTTASLYDQAVREVKPGLSQITKKLDNLVPEESARLKKVTSKLHNLFKEETSNYDSSNQNVEEQGVETMLKGVFATQMEMQDAERSKDDKETKLRDHIESKRFGTEVKLFSRMDNNLQRLGEYTVSTNMAFQKKSLELQFRSYFTLGEMLKEAKESSKANKVTLDGILKNTALPEFVKIKESERFKQIAKDKLWNGLHNRMFGEGTRIQKGLNKLQEKGKELIEGFKQGIDGGLMMTDAMEQIQEMNQMMEETTGKKKTAWESAGQFGGSFLGNHVLSKISGVVKDRIAGNDKMQRWDQKAARWVENPDELINMYKNLDQVRDADLDDSLKGKAYTLFGDFLELFQSEKNSTTGDTGHGTEDLIQSSYTDERSRRAQVDVIPGYLARILREVTVLRTNDDSLALTVYDFETGKFKTQTQLSDDIRESLKRKFKESSLSSAKEVVSKQFMGEGEGTPEDRATLAQALTQITRERGITFDRDGISNSVTYSNLSDKEKSLLDKHVFSKMDGEDLDSEKNKTKLTTGIGLLRKSLPDIEKEIRERISAGQQDALEKSGIITVAEDGKSWTLNEDKYYELSKEGTLATSDINKKTNISKISPKSMLEKIKKIGVFNWNYKPGAGPQGHDFQGPMAQDVNKQLGEEAAPDGKKLDLVSMNGANMSAIQGLSEEVDKLKGGKTAGSEDTNYLKQISENTLKLVKMNQQAFRGLKSGKFKGAGVQQANLTGPSSGVEGVDSVTGFLQTGVALISKGLTEGVKGVWKGGSKAASIIGDNKENIKDAGKFVFDSLATLVGKGLKLGGDVLFTHLPNLAGQAKRLGGFLSKKFKELVNGAQDLYKEGMDSPVIQASLLKAGYYRDQATGKAITTIDELRKIQGHVVNHLGEVIVTAEEVAKGLYNSKGEKIRSTTVTLGKALLGAGMYLGKKAWDSGKHLFTKGREAFSNIPGLESLKASASNALVGAKDRLAGMGFGFGTDKRTFDVLLQIRDLVSIGKPKKLVESILNRTIGKDVKDDVSKAGKKWLDSLNKEKDGGSQPRGFFDWLTGNRKPSEEAPETPEGSTPGTPQTNSTGTGGLLGKLFNKGKEYVQQAYGQREADKNFVGPIRPGDANPMTMAEKISHSLFNRFDKAKGKLKGLATTVGVGEQMGPPLPELVGPAKPASWKDKIQSKINAAKESPSGSGSLIESIVQKVLAAKEKIAKKEGSELVGPVPEMVGPIQPTHSSASNYIRGKLQNVKERWSNRNQSVEPQQPEPTGPAPELVGPQRPARRGKFGMLMNGLSAGKNMVVGAASKLGGIAGALMPSAETPQQDTGPKSIGDRFSGMLNTGKNQIRGMLKRKGAKFNDGDGDGSRDGNAVEQLKKQEDEKQQRLEANKASAEAAAERANEGIKYKSSENVIDTIAKKAGALFDMMKGGIGGFLETAASFLSMDKLKGLAKGAWAAIKNPIKTLRGIGTGVKALGAAAKVGGAASTVMRVANVARTGLMVGGLAMGGTGGVLMSAGALTLTGITAALTSPVVLGALAVAGTAAAGHYVYKRFTRDNLDPWETLRAMQYGLPGNSSSKEYNHVVMNLERYFLDGKIGYQDGKAYLLDKKIDPKEIFSIFSIDTGDKEAASTLSGWLQKRFKPFFLNAVTAMYAVDPKLGLEDLSKLKVEQKKKLLPMVQFLEGPYNETDNPFKSLDVLGTDTEMIKAQVAIIEKQLTKEEGKNEKPSDKFDKTISDIQKAKAEKDAAAKAASDKAMVDKLASKSVAEKPLVEKAGTGFEQGGYNTPSPTAGSTSVATPMMFDEAKPVGNNTTGQAISSTLNAPSIERAAQATDAAGGAPVVTVGNTPTATSTPVKGVKPRKMTESMQKVKEIIAEAGRRVGVDPRIMQIMAAIESSFNPMAKAKTSSATGLFQFINSTWKEMTQKVGAKYGISANSDRTDAMTNSLMGAEFLKGNANTIKKVKPNPSVTDLYIAHFLGPGGAQQFLKSSPDTIGAEVFPKPAKANPSIFRADGGKGGYLSIGQIYQNFENKLKRLAASYGIEFPTSGTNMATGTPPKPMAEGPKEPPPLATVGTTPPTTPSNQGGTMNAVATSAASGAVATNVADTPPPKGSEANKEVRDFQKNSGLYKQPETSSNTETPKDNWQSNNQYKQPPETIPGVNKPTPIVEQAVEVRPEPKKKYPWVIDERPDDIAIGRASNTSKSGEALYGAMDGVKSTMSQQLIVSTEMRDVLKDRVAPALEKMLEVLAGAKSAAPATTPTPPSKVTPTPVRPATQSFLDLKRMA